MALLNMGQRLYCKDSECQLTRACINVFDLKRGEKSAMYVYARLAESSSDSPIAPIESGSFQCELDAGLI